MYQKIGILCASDSELKPFLPHIDNCTTTRQAMLALHRGTIGNQPVVALYCGVCKVNAALAAQLLIDNYRVGAILNVGVAGGMAADVHIFDTVVSTECAYHDVTADVLTEFHPWLSSVYLPADPQLLAAARQVAQLPHPHPIRFGRMVTGEAFIADAGREAILAAHQPLSVDMETAAIAHVCHANRVPFLAVRSITDTADHSGAGHFEENCAIASGIAKDFVLELLEALSEQTKTPQLYLKPLSPDDGRKIYDLLQEIDADDHGFGNKACGMDYPQYREWLQSEYAVDSGKLEDWMVPQSSYWLYCGDTPVGYGRLRHSLNDALRANGGHIGYAIGKPYRGKGYGHALLALLMAESRQLGLTELQITANCDNLRSNRVIAAAGGKLLRKADGKNIYLVAL